MKQLTDHEYVVSDKFEKQIVRKIINLAFVLNAFFSSNRASKGTRQLEQFLRRTFALGTKQNSAFRHSSNARFTNCTIACAQNLRSI
jgi:hypothetical protein